MSSSCLLPIFQVADAPPGLLSTWQKRRRCGGGVQEDAGVGGAGRGGRKGKLSQKLLASGPSIRWVAVATLCRREGGKGILLGTLPLVNKTVVLLVGKKRDWLYRRGKYHCLPGEVMNVMNNSSRLWTERLENNILLTCQWGWAISIPFIS